MSSSTWDERSFPWTSRHLSHSQMGMAEGAPNADSIEGGQGRMM